ncbi:MAG: glycosyltransferase family 2 protein [Mogibacterium sp.]|nr:glycosyltransferase family 2 protein [Mogibacterium sp.]
MKVSAIMKKCENSPIISIIIPVYNVEHYLPECIESVICQTYTNWELLLIDDGSDDNSPFICDDYAARDSRIKSFHQNNMGPSGARNAGLDLACGDFIAMIDADDVLCDRSYIEILLKTLNQTNADIAICHMNRFTTVPSQTNYHACSLEYTLTTGMDFCKKKFPEYNYEFGSPCARLFRSFLFSEIRFPQELIFAEDNAIAHRLYYLCKKIAMLPYPMYGYRQHHNGRCSQPDVYRKLHDVRIAFSDRIDFFREKGYESVAVIAEMEKSQHAAYLLKDIVAENYDNSEISSSALLDSFLETMDSYWGRHLLLQKEGQIDPLRHTEAYRLFYERELNRSLLLFSVLGKYLLHGETSDISSDELLALLPLAHDQGVLQILLSASKKSSQVLSHSKFWAEKNDLLLYKQLQLEAGLARLFRLASDEQIPVLSADNMLSALYPSPCMRDRAVRQFMVSDKDKSSLYDCLSSSGFIRIEQDGIGGWRINDSDVAVFFSDYTELLSPVLAEHLLSIVTDSSGDSSSLSAPLQYLLHLSQCYEKDALETLDFSDLIDMFLFGRL